MRDSNVYRLRAALPRMSWEPANLYNLWRRSMGAKAGEAVFSKSDQSLFQQRWLSKRLLRAYHGDYIPERTFKRWYLPSTLPDVRTRVSETTAKLLSFADREEDVLKAHKLQREYDRQAQAPVASLMWAEIERRIDTVIFRACLAKNIYAARHLVIHGHVRLNGEIYTNVNTRLAPGDMITINPEAMSLLSRKIRNPWKKGPVPPPAPGSANAKRLARLAQSIASEGGVDETEVVAYNAQNNQVELPAPLTRARKFHLPHFAPPFIFVPAYLEVSFPACSVVYVRHPTARTGYSEVPTPYDADGEIMRLAWEWYAKRRPRVRSKTKLQAEPCNRRGHMVFQGIGMRARDAISSN
ncbi:alpha-L RNA-binding motif-containing protein [Auriculariales sp. MPI-PUGE-AT-0066]|nr:alpha-L RNA-binding motif-containing protein [Auriculariales sp. MPI-PUGE-AT-0066]